MINITRFEVQDGYAESGNIFRIVPSAWRKQDGRRSRRADAKNRRERVYGLALEGGAMFCQRNMYGWYQLFRSASFTLGRLRISSDIGSQDYFQVGFQVIEQLQCRVVRVLAVMNRGGEVVIDPAGKRPDAVDAAVPPGKIEKRTVSRTVRPFRQQVQHLLLIGEHIRPTLAALAGCTAGGRSHFPMTEGMGKYPAAEPVSHPVQEGYPAPPVITGPFRPDNPPLQLFDFPCDLLHNNNLPLRLAYFKSLQYTQPGRVIPCPAV